MATIRLDLQHLCYLYTLHVALIAIYSILPTSSCRLMLFKHLCIASKYTDSYGTLTTNTHKILKSLEALMCTLTMELIVKINNTEKNGCIILKCEQTGWRHCSYMGVRYSYLTYSCKPVVPRTHSTVTVNPHKFNITIKFYA